jgi:type I restriction enzyme R subunit
MSNSALSPNFVFLKHHEPQLVRLGTLAERYFKDDPCTCLIKLRQFAELLAQLTAANAGLYQDPRESQIDLLRRLRDRGIVRGEVYEVFNEIRVVGNRATHDMMGNHRTALDTLKFARKLGIWFHRAFGDRNFRPGPFRAPARSGAGIRDAAPRDGALAGRNAALSGRSGAVPNRCRSGPSSSG